MQESQGRLSNVSCLKQVHSPMRSHLIVKGKTLTNAAALGPESQTFLWARADRSCRVAHGSPDPRTRNHADYWGKALPQRLKV